MKHNTINTVSFKKNKKKRNIFVFDAGLHTLRLERKEGEQDMEFATRYLLGYLKGCRERGGSKYKAFLIESNSENSRLVTWGVKNK